MTQFPWFRTFACSGSAAVVLLTGGLFLKAADEKTAAKTAAKTEAKTVAKTEAKTAVKSEKTEIKTEAKTPAKSEAKTAPVTAPAPKTETSKAKKLVSNLENPCGVVVHEKSGHVFISSRWGVYRYDPSNRKIAIEIADYPKPIDVYGKGPKYDIGPLGLAFLDADHLVVGDGSRPDGEEVVRVYKIGPAAPKEPTKESVAAYTLGPIKASAESAKGEGNFYGVAVGGGAIYVTCNGDDTKGWIAKSEIKDGKPGPLTLSIATKVATNVDAPVPVAFSPDGKELVVGQMGEINVPGDSLLTTYDPKTGKLIKKYTTGLNDIAGLAYSPKTKKLYCVDFSWMATDKGGLFELVVTGDKVEARKIMALDKPTALAFDKDGKLYITLFGTVTPAQTAAGKSSGSLIVLEAGL